MSLSESELMERLEEHAIQVMAAPADQDVADSFIRTRVAPYGDE